MGAVEKVPAPKNPSGKHGHAIKRQHGFFAGGARIAVLPAATGAELGAFLKANVAANSHLLTDGFAGYHGADLGEYLKHTPSVANSEFELVDDHFQRFARRQPWLPVGVVKCCLSVETRR